MTKTTTASTTTHFIEMNSANVNGNCQDCAPNLACYTSDTSADFNYCVGRNSIKWYDANNGGLKI